MPYGYGYGFPGPDTYLAFSPSAISGLASWWKADAGITTSEASVESDVDAWTTKTNLTTSGTGPWDLDSTGAGTSTRSVLTGLTNVPSNPAEGRPLAVQVELYPGALEWARVRLTGNVSEVWFHLNGAGSVGTTSGDFDVEPTISSNGSGGYTCQFTVTMNGASLLVGPTDDDNTNDSTASGTETLISVDNPVVTQSRVSAWADQGPKGHDFAQATVDSQPVYTVSGPSFDGVDDVLVTSETLSELAYLHQAGTLIFRWTRNASAVSQVLLSTITDSPSPGDRGVLVRTASGNATALGLTVMNGSGSGFSYAFSGTGLGTTGEKLAAILYDGTSAQIRIGGTQVATANVGTAIDAGDPDGQLNLFGGANGLMPGDAKEIITYDRKLTLPEIQQVEKYLLRRWPLAA